MNNGLELNALAGNILCICIYLVRTWSLRLVEKLRNLNMVNGDICCEDMEGACILLKIYKARIWSTLLSGYAENCYGEVALKQL